MDKGLRQLVRFSVILVLAALAAFGCAHYPVNQPLEQVDPQGGYRGKYMGTPGNSENLLLYLTFSGGGTRAAALSYGVLEELGKIEVVIEGKSGGFSMKWTEYRVYPAEVSLQAITASLETVFLRISKPFF